MPLACGATLHLVDDALVVLDPKAFCFSHLAVPSAITAFLDQQDLSTSIRTINLGGEPLKKTLIQKLFEQSRWQRAPATLRPYGNNHVLYLDFLRAG